ncbi:LysM motif-containing protein [Desulfonema limicola]|uniref:LysM motif-containing protein n=1 Tax=Desulfonema limicola TaxID=45656 RepID=A0A975B4W6_9BACT|nr:LysM peptidoglycan-binding domain-containing protein [Desulfonema limicola]QTA78828.1 LysM motif-containing protein [Desulfonema limicola]
MKLHTAFLTFLLLNFLCGCTAILKDESLVSTAASEKSYSQVKKIKTIPDFRDNNDVSIEDLENNDHEDDLADADNENIEILPELNDALEFCDISQKFWEKGDSDKALNALDHAYSLLLKADTEESPDLTQQKEDLRFTISKRILEIYASRNTSIKGRHNEIPVILNDYVKKEIKNLSKGEFFKNAYKRAGKYRPAILEKLKKAGLPPELSWLPLIESGFTTNALSSARALGLWQFIPSTGYKFGLNRDMYVDERLDPDKSTTAAVSYLKELHRIFGDWATVLAAYNCGEGRVLKTIRSQNVNYLDNFWDLYEKLPRETANYVPRFFATLHMVNNPEKYGLNTIKIDSPLEYETVIVKKQLSLQDIARAINVDPDKLKELNPELRKKIIPKDSYSLKIPPGKDDMLTAKLDTIPVVSQPKPPKSSSQANYAYYRVKKGDSLSKIAKRYNTSVKTILSSNKMHKRHYIVAGNILKIPQTGKANYTGSKKSNHRYTTSTHIVKNGDSLWNIAQKYGTTTKIIHKFNKLPNNKLSIGQVLKIPGKGIKSSKKYLRTYKVKNGDVPIEIAKRHNMSLERLLKVNRLNQHSKIFPGQQLHVE